MKTGRLSRHKAHCVASLISRGLPARLKTVAADKQGGTGRAEQPPCHWLRSLQAFLTAKGKGG